MLFVINDTEPGQADAAALAKRRADLPPLKNVNQLLGWLPGPHGDRGMANDWQPLHKVKWAERDGEYIPLVGSAANALKIFNRHCGTSHIMSSSFRNLLSGCRTFDGGWTKMPDGQMPAAALSLADGSSLVGLRRARSRAQVRAAIAALNPTPMLVEGAHGQHAAGGLAVPSRCGQARDGEFEQMSSPSEYLPVRIGRAFRIAPCGELWAKEFGGGADMCAQNLPRNWPPTPLYCSKNSLRGLEEKVFHCKGGRRKF